MNETLGQGIYSFGEAASLTQVPYQRVRAWIKGWPRRSGPVLAGTKAPQNILSFLELIEVLVAGHLRECGLSMQYLRRAHGAMVEDLATSHPFSHRELLTDGKKLFLRTEERTGDTELREVVGRQHAFDKILRPYLTQLKWDAKTNLARTWEIFQGVLVDPARSFGKPIMIDSGIPARLLADAYRSNNNDTDLVADWYGCSSEDVTRAVAFDDELSGKAA